MEEQEHLPVLLEESVHALIADPNGIYVDGTFGRGGHSRAILARLGAGGRLIAIDRDPEAVAAGRSLAGDDPRFTLVHGRFGALSDLLSRIGITGRIAGLLLDLGVSSPQLDTPRRGFSFTAEGPLDLRMDPQQGDSAATWLARASEREIAAVLKEYGEERFARRIARNIVGARTERPLLTTTDLAALVARSVPSREPGKHPATRTFQAVRIQVNNELDELGEVLAQARDRLGAAGRLVVISFHSLEDRIVKRFLRTESQGPRLPRGLPVPATETRGRFRILGQVVRASDAEVRSNPRSRSAVMRVAERCPP